jgi:hypothetical protein
MPLQGVALARLSEAREGGESLLVLEQNRLQCTAWPKGDLNSLRPHLRTVKVNADQCGAACHICFPSSVKVYFVVPSMMCLGSDTLPAFAAVG